MNAPIPVELIPSGSSGITTILVIAASLSFLLLFITSYVKIAVTFGLLRSAAGLNQTPPNMVLTGIAIILSTFIMFPVFQKCYEAGKNDFAGFVDSKKDPSVRAQSLVTFVNNSSKPLKEFLNRHAHSGEKRAFSEISGKLSKAKPYAQDSFIVLIPAFLISELSEAFQIGFLLFLPFLIIDILVANILMALGMHMLNPTTVSLPFKLLLFVSIDGFSLISRALIMSYT